MTLLYDDPVFPAPRDGRPSGAGRADSANPRRACNRRPGRAMPRPAFEPVSRRRLARVHSPAYIDEVWAIAKSGGGQLEADTVVSPPPTTWP